MLQASMGWKAHLPVPGSREKLISFHCLLLKLQVSSLLTHPRFSLLSSGLSGGNTVTPEKKKRKEEGFSSKTWSAAGNQRELSQEPNGDIDMCVWKSKLSQV